jgi:hypothetical protein
MFSFQWNSRCVNRFLIIKYFSSLGQQNHRQSCEIKPLNWIAWDSSKRNLSKFMNILLKKKEKLITWISSDCLAIMLTRINKIIWLIVYCYVNDVIDCSYRRFFQCFRLKLDKSFGIFLRSMNSIIVTARKMKRSWS